MNSLNQPRVVLLFSGKRKTGKDFITERLLQTLSSDRAEIIRISEPIKRRWAEEHGLDLKQLLSDGLYKERYRKEMIEWSEQMRDKDYGYFCREACREVSKEIVIVSDIRRKTDLQYFEETYEEKVKTIRVIASEETRRKRGWIFQDGVDNAKSECDLDDMTEWDLLLTNEEDTDPKDLLGKITNKIFRTIVL